MEISKHVGDSGANTSIVSGSVVTAVASAASGPLEPEWGLLVMAIRRRHMVRLMPLWNVDRL